MKPFSKFEPVKMLVVRSEPLTDAEIDLALRVSPHTQWWVALTQVIESQRVELAESGQHCALANNALAMAFNEGGYHALTCLLSALEEKASGD